MYTNAWSYTPPCTQITFYVVWRVHPPESNQTMFFALFIPMSNCKPHTLTLECQAWKLGIIVPSSCHGFLFTSRVWKSIKLIWIGNLIKLYMVDHKNIQWKGFTKNLGVFLIPIADAKNYKCR